MEGTTTVTGLRRTIYIATEELWNEIQDAADRKDWSVSRYLMNCHRAYLKMGAKPANLERISSPPERVVRTPRLPPVAVDLVINESPVGGVERKAKVSEMQSQMDRVTGSAPEFRGGYSKDRQTGKKEKK